MHDWDLIVVGAGPAGSAAACHALAIRPALSGRLLLIDKSQFPRDKLCGGGLTLAAERILRQLDVPLPSEVSFVENVEFRFQRRTVVLQSNWLPHQYLFSVVRRIDLDYRLVKLALARGACIQTAAVKDIRLERSAVRIVTETEEEHTARAVIAADGANSTIRRRLGLTLRNTIGAATESSTLQILGRRPANSALFDFSDAGPQLQGYFWDFPSPCVPEPRRSVGVADSRLLSGGPNHHNVTRTLRGHPDTPKDIPPPRSAPLRRFDPASRLSTERIVFAGDAMGCEPLFSEGISTALESGIFAADAVLAAFEDLDFSFHGYDRMFLSSPLGKMLQRKLTIANAFYRNPRRWQYIPIGLLMRRVSGSAPFKSMSSSVLRPGFDEKC